MTTRGKEARPRVRRDRLVKGFAEAAELAGEADLDRAIKLVTEGRMDEALALLKGGARSLRVVRCISCGHAEPPECAARLCPGCRRSHWRDDDVDHAGTVAGSPLKVA